MCFQFLGIVNLEASRILSDRPRLKEGGVVLFQEDEEAALIMPADEIGEAVFRVVYRYVVSFIVEILWDLICFYIGFPVVKLVTLGKYPEGTGSTIKDPIYCLLGDRTLCLASSYFG